MKKLFINENTYKPLLRLFSKLSPIRCPHILNFHYKIIALTVSIGVDFGGQPGHVPPIIEKRPCIHHFLPPSAPQYFGLPTQYFWQVYTSDCKKLWTEYWLSTNKLLIIISQSVGRGLHTFFYATKHVLRKSYHCTFSAEIS